MNRWHTIQLGTLWLTDGNSSSGNPIINEIEGINVLKQGRVGQAIIALDGSVWKQRFPVNGAPLTVSFNLIEQADFESLVNILNAADQGSDISFFIDGDTGTYYGTATTAQDYLDFDSTFLNGRVAGVEARLIIQSQIYQLPVTAGVYTITGNNITLTYSGA